MTTTVTCPRCRVSVPRDKVDMPGRCPEKSCPLNEKRDDRDIDMAAPGYWDEPQEWFVCDACEGSGVEVFGTWVYEHGCGFGHASTDERPCGKCNGAGGWMDDVKPDAGPVHEFPDDDGRWPEFSDEVPF